MTEGIKIVQADVSHLDQLAVLFEGYREFYKQELNAELARKFIEQRLSRGDSIIYVALLGDKIVGFVQLYPLLDSLKLGNLWLLNDLCVLSRFESDFRVSIRLAKRLMHGARGAVGTSAILTGEEATRNNCSRGPRSSRRRPTQPVSARSYIRGC